MMTFDGGDPSHMRQGATITMTGAEVFVEEETCTDAELAHTQETIGLLAIQTGVAGSSNDAGTDPCIGLGSNSADLGNGQGVFNQICPDMTAWHSSTDVSSYTPGEVCDVLVMTRGTNCKQYCTGQGRICLRAQDNSGSGCTIDEGGHLRQTTDENGCLQNWNNQICGCSGDIVGTATQFQDRVCEGTTMNLDCAGRGAEVINIIDASYGRQDGPDVCPHSATSDQNCHEVTSTSIVAAACQGNPSCAIGALNSVFGDPCGGTYKYLTVNYDCGGAGGNASTDLNGDGTVDVTDLLLVLAAFDVDAGGDVDGDGTTNVSDLLALLADFGGTGTGR